VIAVTIFTGLHGQAGRRRHAGDRAVTQLGAQTAASSGRRLQGLDCRTETEPPDTMEVDQRKILPVSVSRCSLKVNK